MTAAIRWTTSTRRPRTSRWTTPGRSRTIGRPTRSRWPRHVTRQAPRTCELGCSTTASCSPRWSGWTRASTRTRTARWGRTVPRTATESAPSRSRLVRSRGEQMREQVDERQEREAEDPLDAVMARSRDRYSSRWGDIQAKFVDEPRQAVEDADRLVEEVMEQVFEACTGERERLAQSWSNGGTDTETMRTTLQRYRRVFAFVLR